MSISRYKGVKYIKSVIPLKKPWMAYIDGVGGYQYLGKYKTEIEAAQAYNEACKSRGQKPNFITEIKYE